MARPTKFGEAFSASYLKGFDSYTKAELEREKAKKAKKAARKAEIDREERRALGVAEARKQSALEALEASAEGPLGEALVDQRISTEQKPLAPRLYEESLRPLTNMQAIRRALPSGDTIEDIRKQQAILAAIKGSERRAAAEPEAFAKAKLDAMASISAKEHIADAQTQLEIDDWKKKQAEHRAEAKKHREGEDAIASGHRRIKQRGKGGQPFDDSLRLVARGRVPTAGEREALYDSWAEGSIIYNQTSSAGELSIAEAQAEADIRAGLSVTNPYNATSDKARYEHFDKFVKLAKMADPIRKRVALEAHIAAGVKIGRDRDNAIMASEKTALHGAAQKQFDMWVKSWFPPVTGAVGGARRPTQAMIRAEAIRRGVDPQAALTTAVIRTIPANLATFRKANYEIYEKHARNWFAEATAVESGQGGKPVHYSTLAQGLGTQEKVQIREETEQQAKDRVTAMSLIEAHGADLNAIATALAGATPARRAAVFNMARSVIKESDAAAVVAARGQVRGAAALGDEQWKAIEKKRGMQVDYILQDLAADAPQKIIIQTVDGPKVIDVYKVIERNSLRPFTPAMEFAAQKDLMQRTNWIIDPSSPKDANGNYIAGKEIWIKADDDRIE